MFYDSNYDGAKLGELIRADVDETYVQHNAGGHRSHLGASLIGDDCQRKLWFTFRWVRKPEFSGRMLRLFKRGHNEEANIISHLRMIGVEFWDKDSNGVQFRMKGVNGHFGGSTDGIARLPEKYGIDEPLIAEFKTMKGGAGFQKLKERGMEIEKHQHYVQMCVYGNAFGIKKGIYVVLNKDNDEYYIEIVDLKKSEAEAAMQKAEVIIYSENAPARISDNSTFWRCKFCDFSDICHGNGNIEKNCRSCENAVPTDGGTWSCRQWGAVIPKGAISDGCDNYRKVY